MVVEIKFVRVPLFPVLFLAGHQKDRHHFGEGPNLKRDKASRSKIVRVIESSRNRVESRNRRRRGPDSCGAMCPWPCAACCCWARLRLGTRRVGTSCPQTLWLLVSLCDFQADSDIVSNAEV